MTAKPVLGISGCLTGSAVRFDGGHKRMGFVMDELAQWVAFRPVCPEMAIGLPTPRPALRLVMTTGGETEMRFSKAPDDVTHKMAAFTADYLPKIGDLSGFIVCAKSPAAAWSACGCTTKTATGAARRVSGCSPPPSLKLPLAARRKDGRLHDPVLRENFVERVLPPRTERNA